MNSHETPNVQTSQSYPSPTAVPIHDPFFAHQQRLSPSHEAQIAAQLSRGHPMMSGNINNGGGAGDMSQAHPGDDMRRASEIDSDAQHDGSMNDPSAPRKRSKVSRACDECRRKKIRCDATSESGPEQCTSCKRTGVHCQFSRVPMKRGPSKGYIKELADRLITLENSMMTPGGANEIPYAPMEAGDHSPRMSEDFSPQSANPPHARSSRKRTHSASNEFQTPNYSHTMHRPSIGGSPWPPQELSRHLPLPPAGLQNPATPQSNSSFMEQGHPSRSQYSPNGGIQSHLQGMRENVTYDTDPRIAEQDVGDGSFDWDEKAVDEYYRMIHPVLPLLPTTKERLHSRLSRCPATLREAFLEALYATTRGLPGSSIAPSDRQNIRKANDLIAASQFDQMASRSPSINLIYLQAMLLMTLEADNHGPAAMKRPLGPPRSVWLSSAVGLAYFLRLHIGPSRERIANDELDRDERLGRRIWWILVTLDRWHALSTASPVLIPDTVVTLMPGDQRLLGDQIYQLARVSLVIGHVAEVCLNPDAATPKSTSAPLLGRLLAGELDRFRESIDANLPTLPIVHLAYLHVSALVKRFTSPTNPHEILEPVETLVAALSASLIHTTPLSHHFSALTALTLAELSDVPETKELALKSLHAFHDTLQHGAPEDPNPAENISWHTAIRDIVARKLHNAAAPSTATTTTNQGGLQRLADLAVGERGQAESQPAAASSSSQGGEQPSAAATTTADKGFDPMYLTREGYLNLAAEEWGRARS
ncbi:MAG: transcriptional repressor general negative regulator of transcription subunit 4 [Chaenotheca gracillima]|nr:MAG: transcriptional repressor general negative regulator of transcription subunit 4 [Chaenotheca gracillima]